MDPTSPLIELTQADQSNIKYKFASRDYRVRLARCASVDGRPYLPLWFIDRSDIVDLDIYKHRPYVDTWLDE